MNLANRTNPIALSKSAAGLAGTVAGVAGFAAKGAVHVVGAATGLARKSAPSGDEHEAARERSTAEPSGPTVVLAEPHAPEEPPVDVVGMALAAEAEAEREGGSYGGAFAHEPRAASRDEEHGAAALQRTTVEEIVDETAAALDEDTDRG